MNYLTNSLLLLGSFFLMEGVAWFTHKYIMHGFLWVLHKSHHEPREGILEKNDWFGVFFSLPSIYLVVMGAADYDWKFYVGLGIALYGLAYFLVHDVLVHQRVKMFTKVKSAYVKAMRGTHHLHHSVHTKEGASAFGFLFVLPKYYKRFSGK